MGFLLFRSSIFMSLREYFSSYLEYLLSVDISFVKDNWGGWEAFIEVFCWQTNQTFRGFQRQENYFLVVDNGITPPNFTFTFVFNHHHHHHHKRAEKLLLNCSVDKQERLRGTFVPTYLFPGHQGAGKGLTNKENFRAKKIIFHMLIIPRPTTIISSYTLSCSTTPLIQSSSSLQRGLPSSFWIVLMTKNGVLLTMIHSASEASALVFLWSCTKWKYWKVANLHIQFYMYHPFGELHAKLTKQT